MDMRMGRIEGRLDEALPNIQRRLDDIFKKLDGLPCSEEGERVKAIETRMDDWRKSRYIWITAGASCVVGAFLYIFQLLVSMKGG
jgi:hypothetical protein